MTAPTKPPVWTEAQFKRDSKKSIENFKYERLQEDPAQFFSVFDRKKSAVEQLLDASSDLAQLTDVACDIVTDDDLLEALRYLAAPPISADDLQVLADVETLNANRLRNDPEMAKRLVETVIQALDHRRFTWVAQQRDPTDAERLAAAMASAALIASQRIATDRRTNDRRQQEDQVAKSLIAIDFTEVNTRTVRNIREAPDPGQFCRESKLGTRKADFIISLLDGRIMAIECKVSNSATNSVKRLNNDAAAKAVVWQREFGAATIVPAAVLAGVFKLNNLQDAQSAGLAIFWAHNLKALTDFVSNAT